jgi:hypothetical protein
LPRAAPIATHYLSPYEQIAVPPQDRIRTDQQQEPAQLLPREKVKQAGKDEAVGVGERGLADLAL